MSDLYQRLGLKRSATTDEIKKSYRDLARQHHPDKGGDVEMFKGIQEAHEVLSDDRRRQVYDATGSVNEQPQPPPGPSFPFSGGMGGFAEMFGGMFGQGGMGGGQQQRRGRGPSSQVDAGMSLENFYNGFTFNINFKQGRKCSTCSSSLEPCVPCGGQGFRIAMRHMGPMIVQAQEPCGVCRGRGKKPSGNCSTCGGKQIVESEKSIEATVLPGMAEGDRIVFEGECSDTFEYDMPGDVVVVLRLSPTKYEWKGSDLHYTHEISYAESVLGFELFLPDHPSRKMPSYRWTGGPVISGSSLVFVGGGMPKRGGTGFGDLVIHLTIRPTPPTPWSSEDREKLESILGKVVLSKTDASDLSYAK